MTQLDQLDEMAGRLFRADFSETAGLFKDSSGEIRDWLTRSGGLGAVPDSTTIARNRATTLTAQLAEAVDNSISLGNGVELLLISDTNVYAREPKIEGHFELAGEPCPTERAGPTVAFVPQQVLTELDKKKDEGEEWAKKATKRLKGLRNQGNIVEGVKVVRSCSAIGEAFPPDTSTYSANLDAGRGDDRILCSVMAVEVRFPASPVVFLTADGAAATKAAFFGLNCVEL